jgi:thiol-disulfide isomerase/thioredoxin
MRRAAVFIPLGIFLALAVVFFYRIGGDHTVVPSALIGKPAPQIALPALEGAKVGGFDPASLKGNVTLVNVWASWCAPCRVEHPLLAQLSKDKRIRVVGINYKDQPINAVRFLTAARRSNGAFTVSRRPSWSGATAPSATSWSDRSRRRILRGFVRRSRRRWPLTSLSRQDPSPHISP